MQRNFNLFSLLYLPGNSAKLTPEIMYGKGVKKTYDVKKSAPELLKTQSSLISASAITRP